MKPQIIHDKYFDKNALKGICYLKGNNSYLAAISDILHCTEQTASYKINHGALSHEDTIILAQGLEMTPRQYINIFMRGVFDLDQ